MSISNLRGRAVSALIVAGAAAAAVLGLAAPAGASTGMTAKRLRWTEIPR